MAERRMLSKKIIESDAFLDMPLSTQALYMHMNMAADDDGIVNAPKRVQRSCGASEDDLRLLQAKGFVLVIDDVMVIKHWLINNYIRRDRYHRTEYVEQAKMLGIKDNLSYTLDDDQMVTRWLPDGYQMGDKRLTEDKLGKDRQGYISRKKKSGFPEREYSEEQLQVMCKLKGGATDVTSES